jgi:VWFA-related protein
MFVGVAPGAQQPPEAPAQASGSTTLHVNSRLVVLDVVVLDKAGHPLSGLDRSQFSVTEDRVPQTIRSFDPPLGHSMPPGSEIHALVHGAVDLERIGNAPVNILVFDELNTSWDGTAYARLQMQRFLKSQPDVLPVPTLLLVAGDSRFAVLHDYTQSRAELLESVRKYLPQYPFQMMRGSSGNTNIEVLEKTLGTLSQIAESTRGTPGRKNVIWVGAGYPSINTATLKFDDEEKLMAVIRRVTDRMLSARVTLFMVDPQGVQTGTQDSGIAGDDGTFVQTVGSELGPFTGSLDFATFALTTGGEIFASRNDVDAAIGESIADGGVYYTLSYVPTNSSEDPTKYRNIHVRLKDPSLHAVTRDGYFLGVTPVDPIPNRDTSPSNQLHFDMVSAARTRLVYNGLNIQARRTAEGYQLLVATKGLHWTERTDGSRIAEVTAMTVFFNARDKELQSHAMELKESVGNDVQVDGDGWVALTLPMQLSPATARVRFVVRDAASGAIGTADARP